MRNRVAGFLILGIDALIGFIIFAFNQALTDIVNTSCSHGTTCPMWKTIELQTNISLGIVVFIAAIGLYLVFFGEDTRIITRIRKVHEQAAPKKITEKNFRKVMEGMQTDEKVLFEKIIESQGTIFQSELVIKTGFPKAKVTRILDRLEGRGIIERKRRGMTNVVIIKR